MILHEPFQFNFNELQRPRVEEAMWRSIRWLDRCINAHTRPEEQNLYVVVGSMGVCFTRGVPHGCVRQAGRSTSGVPIIFNTDICSILILVLNDISKGEVAKKKRECEKARQDLEKKSAQFAGEQQLMASAWYDLVLQNQRLASRPGNGGSGGNVSFLPRQRMASLQTRKA